MVGARQINQRSNLSCCGQTVRVWVGNPVALPRAFTESVFATDVSHIDDSWSDSGRDARAVAPEFSRERAGRRTGARPGRGRRKLALVRVTSSQDLASVEELALAPWG